MNKASVITNDKGEKEDAMGRAMGFRAGQRVRIRPDADTEFAGHQGTIVYVGEKSCDVKIKYRPPGSKTPSTYIGHFPKSDLERGNARTELTSFSLDSSFRQSRTLMWIIVLALVVFLLILTAEKVL